MRPPDRRAPATSASGMMARSFLVGGFGGLLLRCRFGRLRVLMLEQVHGLVPAFADGTEKG